MWPELWPRRNSPLPASSILRRNVVPCTRYVHRGTSSRAVARSLHMVLVLAPHVNPFFIIWQPRLPSSAQAVTAVNRDAAGNECPVRRSRHRPGRGIRHQADAGQEDAPTAAGPPRPGRGGMVHRRDEAYGDNPGLRDWLDEHDINYVMAVSCDTRFATHTGPAAGPMN